MPPTQKFTFLLVSFLLFTSHALADEPLGPPSPDQQQQEDKSIIAQQKGFPEYLRWPIIYARDYIFSAHRSVEGIEHVSDHISVLTYEDMLKLPARDLDEAIGYIPGVTNEDIGNIGHPVQATIGGGLSRQVLVVFDDIKMNTTTEGLAELAQFPIEAVGKVEVIKGPSSSTWGSSLSGVINMITKPVGTSLVPHGSATYAWGKFGTERRYFDTRQKIGPLAYLLAGSHVESGGFRRNSDIDEKKLYAKTEIDVVEGLKLKGGFGYFGQSNSEFEDFGALTFQKREVITKLGRMGVEINPTDWVSVDFAAKFHDRNFTVDSFDLTPGTLGALLDVSTGDSVVPEGSLRTDIEISDRQFLTAGVEAGKEIIRARRLTLGARGITQRFNVRDTADTQGYYGNYRHHFRYLDVILGSRFDNNNAFGHQYSPSGGLVVHLPFVKSRIKFNYQRAFNAPPLSNRFVSSVFFALFNPNPDIRAERSTAYSTAIVFNPFTWLDLETTFYQNFVKDAIVTRDEDGKPGGARTFKNIGRERRDGVDGEMHFRPWQGLDFLYAVNFVQVTDRTVHSAIVRGRPRLSYDLGVTLDLPFDLHWSLRGKYIDTNQDPGLAVPSDQEFIFDSKIFWRLPRIFYGNMSVYLQVDNMFNRTFAFDKNFNHNPGRHYELGLRYEW